METGNRQGSCCAPWLVPGLLMHMILFIGAFWGRRESTEHGEMEMELKMEGTRTGDGDELGPQTGTDGQGKARKSNTSGCYACNAKRRLNVEGGMDGILRIHALKKTTTRCRDSGRLGSERNKYVSRQIDHRETNDKDTAEGPVTIPI